MEFLRIKNEIRRIRGLGFIESKTNKGHDGEIGRTFEDLLGIKENNSRDPDYIGFEVKTQKQISKAPITLFSRAPNSPSRAMRLLRDTFGDYRDDRFPNKKKLFASVFANRWCELYGLNCMKLNLNNSQKRIELVIKRNKLLFEVPIYWNYEDIELGLRKIDKLIVVKADIKTDEGKTYFQFTECKVYLNVEFERFLKALKSGLIQFDIRLGIYASGKNKGKYHNHGGGFRIKSKDLSSLYKHDTTI